VETDPGLWLNDYRLASQLGGTTDDAVIIRNLPYILQTLHAPGSNIFRPTRSTTGLI
jgi:hypothetical protein